MYTPSGKKFAAHQVVHHGKKEYVNGDAYTNTIEGFSIFKRSMVGVYQQCSERHLHRYLTEFDFRYSARQKLGVNDQQRTARAVMVARASGSRMKQLVARSRRLPKVPRWMRLLLSDA